LTAFSDRIAVNEGEGSYYRLQDGRGVLLSGRKEPPPAILALDIRERAGGGQARRVEANLFLGFEIAAIQEAFPDECAWQKVSEFDEKKKRALIEERLMFRGLILDRREPRKDDRKASAEIWAEKFAAGELEHPGYDEKARQFTVRVR